MKCPACINGKQNLCANWWLLGLDRVHGTFAEFTAVPDIADFSRSPARLSDTEAVFAEPLANVVHFFRIAMTEIPESLAIFGAGPIGSLALALAKLRGIPKVCVIDRIDARLEVARQLGADCVINSAKEDAVAAVRNFTKTGAEFVIDAVGIDVTRRAGVNACARGGAAGVHRHGRERQRTAVDRNDPQRTEHLHDVRLRDARFPDIAEPHRIAQTRFDGVDRNALARRWPGELRKNDPQSRRHAEADFQTVTADDAREDE